MKLIPALGLALIIATTATHGASPTTYETIDRAIAKGDLEDVKTHLSNDPKCANQGGTPTSRAPLEQAILRKKSEIALLLIESGANPNTANTSKRTPLHIAVQRNQPTVVTALLKAGAKPNELDKDGWTPLHHAAAKDLADIAKALVTGGANAKALSERGGTPLHEAACSGGKEIIEFLLKQEIDPSIKSKDGVTALDVGKEYKNQAAIDILSKL